MGWRPLELCGPNFALSTMVFKVVNCLMAVKIMLKSCGESGVKYTFEPLAGWLDGDRSGVEWVVFLFASLPAGSTDFPCPSWAWPCSRDTSAVKSQLCFCQGRDGNSEGQLGAQVGLLSLPVFL